ncbi:MAG: hypothetical protein AAGI46_00050 [Planctomycetota bacterium]
MTRDTRNNLIFLGVLLVLTLPPMFLLVGKAWRGEGGLNATPPAAKIKTAYLNPVGVGSGVIRIVPPATDAFVDDLARDLTGEPAFRLASAGGRPSPLIGEDFRLELLGELDDETLLVIWLHRDGADLDSVTSPAGGMRVVTHVDVPSEVRKELQEGPASAIISGYSGYAAPPRRVAVVALKGTVPERLTVSWNRGEMAGQDTIDLSDVTPTRASTLPALPNADIPASQQYPR